MLKGVDPHYGACRPLFDDLRDGKRRVYMSSLVAGEVVQVARREGVRMAARGQNGDAARAQAAMASAGEIVGGFFKELAVPVRRGLRIDPAAAAEREAVRGPGPENADQVQGAR